MPHTSPSPLSSLLPFIAGVAVVLLSCCAFGAESSFVLYNTAPLSPMLSSDYVGGATVFAVPPAAAGLFHADANQTLIAIWEAASINVTTPGLAGQGFVTSLSPDAGKTWLPPQPVLGLNNATACWSPRVEWIEEGLFLMYSTQLLTRGGPVSMAQLSVSNATAMQLQVVANTAVAVGGGVVMGAISGPILKPSSSSLLFAVVADPINPLPILWECHVVATGTVPVQVTLNNCTQQTGPSYTTVAATAAGGAMPSLFLSSTGSTASLEVVALDSKISQLSMWSASQVSSQTFNLSWSQTGAPLSIGNTANPSFAVSSTATAGGIIPVITFNASYMTVQGLCSNGTITSTGAVSLWFNLPNVGSVYMTPIFDPSSAGTMSYYTIVITISNVAPSGVVVALTMALDFGSSSQQPETTTSAPSTSAPPSSATGIAVTFIIISSVAAILIAVFIVGHMRHRRSSGSEKTALLRPDTHNDHA